MIIQKKIIFAFFLVILILVSGCLSTEAEFKDLVKRAIETNNSELCNYAQKFSAGDYDAGGPKDCFEQYARENLDADACLKIPDYYTSGDCLSEVSYKKHEYFCDLAKNTVARSACINNLHITDNRDFYEYKGAEKYRYFESTNYSIGTIIIADDYRPRYVDIRINVTEHGFLSSYDGFIECKEQISPPFILRRTPVGTGLFPDYVYIFSCKKVNGNLAVEYFKYEFN